MVLCLLFKELFELFTLGLGWLKQFRVYAFGVSYEIFIPLSTFFLLSRRFFF